MLGELRGKLDVARSTDASRLEDTLTDAVLCPFRYLPRESALAALLSEVAPVLPVSADDLDKAQIDLWPRLATGTEPDVAIVVGGWVVLLEAKYRSSFGIDSDGTHQLERQWLDGRRHAAARRLSGPIVVAVTDHPKEPEDLDLVRDRLRVQIHGTLGCSAEDVIRWVPWQGIATLLDEVRNQQTMGGRQLIDDVLELMDARGVRHMFEGFSKADYWLMAAARDAADRRVYPAISELRRELIALLDDDGVGWGASDTGVWMYSSKAADKPSEWPASSVTLPFWPKDWPARAGTQAALICTFSFVEPMISVGFVQIARSIGASSKHWTPRSEELSASLRSLPDRFDVAVDDSYARQLNVRRAGEVDGPWLADSFKRSGSLWILQRFSIDEFSNAETARVALLEAKTEVEQRPVIFEAAADAELLAGPYPSE